MTRNRLSSFASTAFAATAMFVASNVFSASAQNQRKEEAKSRSFNIAKHHITLKELLTGRADEYGDKPGFFDRIGAYAMLFSGHSDKEMYYNNFNPGGAVTYQLGKLRDPDKWSVSLAAGAYHNSLQKTSAMAGIKVTKKIPNWPVRGGILIGGVTYSDHLAADRQSFTYEYSKQKETPQDYSDHGVFYKYSESSPVYKPDKLSTDPIDLKKYGISNGFVYVAEVTDKRALGEGPNRLNLVAAPFVEVQFGENNNFSLMAQGLVLPKKDGGCVYNVALAYSPSYALFRHKRPKP